MFISLFSSVSSSEIAFWKSISWKNDVEKDALNTQIIKITAIEMNF